MPKKLQKIVVIVGPTASGKTSLAIDLATSTDGEVVSADSRQVYKGFDIGTDKATHEEMCGIPHHLIDIVDPRLIYTAADFVRDADVVIADIASRGKLPIVAGGTFFYIEALLGKKTLAETPADPALRAKLQALSPETLYERLASLDAAYAEKVDRHNPRRLIRAVEIASAKGNVPSPAHTTRYDARIIGIDIPLSVLRERINARIDKNLALGLVEETKRLLAEGIPESRLGEIGLEYRVVLAYLCGKHEYEKMRAILQQKVWQYARRQRTWLKKMEDVRWYTPANTTAIETTIRQFLL